MTWQTARLGFASTHPSAAGHFPGNPMIPGALLLDEIIVAIAGERRDASLVVKSAKFLRSVRPGEDLDLRWQALPQDGVTFECRVADVLAVSGRLAFRAES